MVLIIYLIKKNIISHYQHNHITFFVFFKPQVIDAFFLGNMK